MKVIYNKNTIELKDVPDLSVVVCKTGSDAFFELLVRYYKNGKQKFTWVSLDNAHTLQDTPTDSYDTKQEAILKMISLGFEPEVFFTGTVDGTEKEFIEWVNKNN